MFGKNRSLWVKLSVFYNRFSLTHFNSKTIIRQKLIKIQQETNRRQIIKIFLENLKNITSFTRFFEERYVQITSIRKRMGLAKHQNGIAGTIYYFAVVTAGKRDSLCLIRKSLFLFSGGNFNNYNNKKLTKHG